MKWIKPSGTEIETNDEPENIAQAKSLGWKPVEAEEPSPPADSGAITKKGPAASGAVTTDAAASGAITTGQKNKGKGS